VHSQSGGLTGLLSYGTFLSTDLERLREVIKRVNKSPLGAGAIVGHPFGIDREAMAEELGFEGIINNSTAAVADRDFVVEALQWAATTMQHISCWAGRPDPVFDCRVRIREAGGCILHRGQSDAPKEEPRFT
jgi:Lyase